MPALVMRVGSLPIGSEDAGAAGNGSPGWSSARVELTEHYFLVKDRSDVGRS